MNSLKSILTKEVLEHFEIKITNHRPKRIMFPVRDEKGKQIAWVEAEPTSNIFLQRVRFTHKIRKAKSELGFPRQLYHCENIVAERDHLVITLGIPEVWRLWQCGFPEVVATLKKELDDNNLEFIDSMVKPYGMLWVITDGDVASLKNGSNLAGQLAKIRFTRHVNTSKRTATSSFDEIRRLFSS